MRVERLSSAHREEAAGVLEESFYDYPYMRFVLRDSGGEYRRHLEALLRFVLDARFARGHPVLGAREAGVISGVATVSEPEAERGDVEVERRRRALCTRIGDAACLRMARWEEVAHSFQPEEPFHYLGMLGVLPDHRGTGQGSRLVEAVRDLVRRHPTSTGLCLNTELPVNVALYEHLGFEVIGEADIADVHTWCMFWRLGEDA